MTPNRRPPPEPPLDGTSYSIAAGFPTKWLFVNGPWNLELPGPGRTVRASPREPGNKQKKQTTLSVVEVEHRHPRNGPSEGPAAFLCDAREYGPRRSRDARWVTQVRGSRRPSASNNPWPPAVLVLPTRFDGYARIDLFRTNVCRPSTN